MLVILSRSVSKIQHPTSYLFCFECTAEWYFQSNYFDREMVKGENILHY